MITTHSLTTNAPRWPTNWRVIGDLAHYFPEVPSGDPWWGQTRPFTACRQHRASLHQYRQHARPTREHSCAACRQHTVLLGRRIPPR